MKKYLILLLLVVPILGFAQEINLEALSSSLQQKIDELKAQILQLQGQLAVLEGSEKELIKFTKILHRGIRDKEVEELQRFLKQFPDIYPEGLVTGYFGSRTEAAVRRLQEKEGIEPVGTVGPKTRARLNVLITQGAGSSGLVPPGLLTAPGLQDKIATTTISTTTPATTTPATPVTSGPKTDEIPPIISDFLITYINQDSAGVTWTTNELTRSEFLYAPNSLTNTITANTRFGTDYTRSDSVNLINLSSGTTYHYVVVAKDRNGNVATSSKQSFTTPASSTGSSGGSGGSSGGSTSPSSNSFSNWSNVQITNFSGNGNIYYGEYPAITWDGNGYGIVWEGHDGNPEQSNIENIFFAKLNQSGNMIGSPVRLSNHGYCGCLTAYPPNIAWNGSNYGVVWGDVQFTGGESGGSISGNYLRLVTLDSNGNKLTDNLGSSYSGGAGIRPGIKVDGSSFAVSSTEYTPDFTGRASSSGGKIYFNNTDVSNELVSVVDGSNTYPHIAWTGSKYAIAWMNIQNNLGQLYFGSR